MEVAHNLLDDLESLDSRTGFGRSNKKTKHIKSNKGQEDEEGHDRLRSEGTRNIKEVVRSVFKLHWRSISVVLCQNQALLRK